MIKIIVPRSSHLLEIGLGLQRLPQSIDLIFEGRNITMLDTFDRIGISELTPPIARR